MQEWSVLSGEHEPSREREEKQRGDPEATKAEPAVRRKHCDAKRVELARGHP